MLTIISLYFSFKTSNCLTEKKGQKMSKNWIASYHHEEKHSFNEWNCNPKMSASGRSKDLLALLSMFIVSLELSKIVVLFEPKTDYDTSNGFTAKEMHQQRSDNNSNVNSNHTPKNPWNQIFMQHDIDGQTNDDYNLSSSLKTIWGDISESAQPDAEYSRDTKYQSVQHGKNVNGIGNGVQSSKSFGQGFENDVSMANANSLKGRAITSRNSSYASYTGIENGNGNQVILGVYF